MTDFEIKSQCPHCLGPLDLEVRPKYRLGGMKKPHLAIVTVTQAEPRAEAFLQHMRDLATDLGAEFVIGFDTRYGPARLPVVQQYADVAVLVRSEGFIESVLQDVLDSTEAIWRLRLDDDEMVTSAMWAWLKDRRYTEGDKQVWSFPTATLWPSTMTFISSGPFWTDRHQRLHTWRYSTWPRVPHGAYGHGPGAPAPVAIAHHKLLVKPLQERRRIWEARDKEKPNAERHYSMTLPELYFDRLTVYPVGSGYFPEPDTVKDAGTVIDLTSFANQGTVGEQP